MKNILLIISLITLLLSCSTENKKVEPEKGKSLLITNIQNTDSIMVNLSGDYFKDVMLILDSLNFGNYTPNPINLCYGKPNEIITKTSDYGEIEYIEIDRSLDKTYDSSAIGGFYLDTHDYTIYEYNEHGMIEEYRFEASVRSDLYHQTKFFYSEKRLDSISSINQAEYYREIINGKESQLNNDGIYSVKINYNSENQLSRLIFVDFKKDIKKLYTIIDCQ